MCAIRQSQLDVKTVTALIQDIIEMEKTQSTANQLINNESEYLKHEYRIAHAQILMSLLRCNCLTRS